MAEFTEFGKKVKKALVDMGRNGKWLAQQVSLRSGMYFDDSYLSNLLHGQKRSERFETVIREVLGIPAKEQEVKEDA